MLNGFLKLLNITLLAAIVPLIISVILVPPALVCFYMGWSFCLYDNVVGAWFMILFSWFMVLAFCKGWLN